MTLTQALKENMGDPERKTREPPRNEDPLKGQVSQQGSEQAFRKSDWIIVAMKWWKHHGAKGLG